MKTTIPKRKSYAFGKDVYLLGYDKHGKAQWLEQATWDCGWYWGLGYVEEYTAHEHPDRSRDIVCHRHFEGILGKHEDGKYYHHLNESPEFSHTVLTEKESWQLAELMKTAYTLRETAGLFNRGGAHLTTNACQDLLRNPVYEEHINKVLIPAVMAQVYELLSPKP
jgi:hypothetical protein